MKRIYHRLVVGIQSVYYQVIDPKGMKRIPITITSSSSTTTPTFLLFHSTITTTTTLSQRSNTTTIHTRFWLILFQLVVLLFTTKLVLFHLNNTVSILESSEREYVHTTTSNVNNKVSLYSNNNHNNNNNHKKYHDTSNPVRTTSSSTTSLHLEKEEEEEEVLDMEIETNTTTASIKKHQQHRYIRFVGYEDLQTLLKNNFQHTLCSTFFGRTGEWFNMNDPNTLSVFDSIPPTTLDVSFSCKDLFHKSNYGTGNYIMLLYNIRMAARQIGNIEVSLKCPDAQLYKNQLIVPWLMGTYKRRIWDSDTFPTKVRIWPTVAEACSSTSISYMIKDIRYDLRRMVVATTGIPFNTSHPSEEWAKMYLWSRTALYQQHHTAATMQIPVNRRTVPEQPKIQYDDVAIHFRCGDIVDSDDTRFGFMKFTSIAKYISPEAKTIGILTQPFDTPSSSTSSNEIQMRTIDTSWNIHKRCKKIVYALQKYLQTTNGHAKVSIHNNPNDTIVDTYSRIIMANQSIIGTSSFGAIAGIASFGTSYILNTNYDEGPNKWLLRPNIMIATKNVILMDEPILFGTTVKSHWWNGATPGEQILDWLHNKDIVWNNSTFITTTTTTAATKVTT